VSVSAGKPLEGFSVGNLSVTLWENTFETPEGPRPVKSVSVRKTFYNKEKKDTEARTVSVDLQEIGCLIGLLSKMEAAVVRHWKPDSTEQRDPNMPF
jgi:hypothetical protein